MHEIRAQYAWNIRAICIKNYCILHTMSTDEAAYFAFKFSSICTKNLPNMHAKFDLKCINFKRILQSRKTVGEQCWRICHIKEPLIRKCVRPCPIAPPWIISIFIGVIIITYPPWWGTPRSPPGHIAEYKWGSVVLIRCHVEGHHDDSTCRL